MKRKYGGQKLLRFLGQCINIKITFADGQMGYTSYDAAEENFVHLLLFKNRHSSSSSSSSLLARRVAPRVLSLPEIEFVREREREREREILDHSIKSVARKKPKFDPSFRLS